ncbi:MAG TPA: hypothetical protein VMZ26_12810 [Pyrinomonadaceae bacterium]|nr:hypothetical protein [Pyrinomonadaceae bacterium]
MESFFMLRGAYTILQTSIVRHHDGENELLARAIRNDLKGKISIVLYIVGIITAFLHQSIAHLIYVVVALIWLVRDRRIESTIETNAPSAEARNKPRKRSRKIIVKKIGFLPQKRNLKVSPLWKDKNWNSLVGDLVRWIDRKR